MIKLEISEPLLFILGMVVGYFIWALKQHTTPPPDSEPRVRRDIGDQLQRKAAGA